MARDHARIHVAIWRDADFLALPAHAQHLYLTIISHPRLSYCGVLDYLPSRLASLACDQNETKVRLSVKALERTRFVVVDRNTSELAARSYVRHDGVLQRVNMGKAMGRALAIVESDRIKVVIRDELARLYRDDSSLAGWEGLKAEYPMEFDMASGMAFAMALPMESVMPSGEE